MHYSLAVRLSYCVHVMCTYILYLRQLPKIAFVTITAGSSRNCTMNAKSRPLQSARGYLGYEICIKLMDCRWLFPAHRILQWLVCTSVENRRTKSNHTLVFNVSSHLLFVNRQYETRPCSSPTSVSTAHSALNQCHNSPLSAVMNVLIRLGRVSLPTTVVSETHKSLITCCLRLVYA